MRRHAAFIAVAALMLAYAWPMQGFGYNQTSHYALIKALADHTAVVDQALGYKRTGSTTSATSSSRRPR